MRTIACQSAFQFTSSEIPRTTYEIHNRLNEITFNASLMKELRAAAFLQEIIQHQNIDRQAYRDGRFHLIQSGDEMRKLSVSSKLSAEWAFLEHLHASGRSAAKQWLDAHFDDLVRCSTWGHGFVFEESLQPAHLPAGIERKAFK